MSEDKKVLIRDAVASDAGRLLEIFTWYVKHTAISYAYDPPSLAEFEGMIRTVTEKYPFLVAEVDGVVTGYAFAHAFVGRTAYSWSSELTIYLDRDFRRCGLGKLLYEELERRLKQMGIQNLYACIAYPRVPDEFLDTNSADFHAHMGFTQAGIFHLCAYKFGRWYDMIWMEKLIGEHKTDEEHG